MSEETIIQYACRVNDQRRATTPQKVLDAIQEVGMPPSVRTALIERLKAAGVL
jgi:hypothetical protein